MGIVMVARIYEGSRHVGFRLIDSTSRQVKDVGIASVTSMLSRGVDIDNLKLVGDNIECKMEDIEKYPCIVDEVGRDTNKFIFIGNSDYDYCIVSDYNGNMISIKEQELIGYSKDYDILNGRVVVIPFGNETDIIIKKIIKANTTYEDAVKSYREHSKKLHEDRGDKIDSTNMKSDTLELGYHVTDDGCMIVDDKYTLRSLRIPSCVDKIPTGACEDAIGLRSVSGGENLVYLGRNAFNRCDNLKSIDLSRSKLIELDTMVINNCKSLENIALPQSIEVIYEWALAGNSITNIKIPDATRQILEHAFHMCSKLENIKWGNSLKYIGEEAFAVCDALTEVEIPSGVEVIDNMAFCVCKGLRRIYIPDTIKTLKNDFVKGCNNLEEVVIPKRIQKTAKLQLDAKTKITTY
jgi:hypothetical protein